MAGESAREVARRRREALAYHERRAEGLKRSAELWDKGAEGEAATAAALESLRGSGWAVVHDIAWPGRPRANIDHVVVGSGGVYVVDSKNWTGAVTVRDDVLRCGGRSRDRQVRAVADAATAVGQTLGIPAVPVLTLVREEPVATTSRGVLLTSTATVVEMLLSRPARLSTEEVTRVVAAIATWPSATDPARRDTGLGGSARSARGGSARSARGGSARGGSGRGGSGRVRSGRARSRSRTGRFRDGVVARVLVSVVLLGGVLWAGTHLYEWASSGVHRLFESSGTFGSTVAVGKTAFHPALEVRAGTPTRVRVIRSAPAAGSGETAPSSAASPARPRRVAAIRVRFHNAGGTVWRSETWLSMRIVADDGRTYPAVEVGRIRAGRLLEQPLALRPGRSIAGYVAFPAPRGARVDTLLMDLGPAGHRVRFHR